ASLAEELQGRDASLRSTPADKEREAASGIAAARAALKQKLDGFQTDLQRLVDLNRTLNGQITELTERVQTAEAEKRQLVAAGAALEDRVQRLTVALAGAQDERQALNDRVARLESQVTLSQRTQLALVNAVEQAQASAPFARAAFWQGNLYPMQ